MKKSKKNKNKFEHAFEWIVENKDGIIKIVRTIIEIVDNKNKKK